MSISADYTSICEKGEQESLGAVMAPMRLVRVGSAAQQWRQSEVLVSCAENLKPDSMSHKKRVAGG